MNVERVEEVPLSFVELVLKLNPVQAQRVQEAFQRIHQHQDSERHRAKHHERENELYLLSN